MVGNDHATFAGRWPLLTSEGRASPCSPVALRHLAVLVGIQLCHVDEDVAPLRLAPRDLPRTPYAAGKASMSRRPVHVWRETAPSPPCWNTPFAEPHGMRLASLARKSVLPIAKTASLLYTNSRPAVARDGASHRRAIGVHDPSAPHAAAGLRKRSMCVPPDCQIALAPI